MLKLNSGLIPKHFFGILFFLVCLFAAKPTQAVFFGSPVSLDTNSRYCWYHGCAVGSVEDVNSIDLLSQTPDYIFGVAFGLNSSTTYSKQSQLDVDVMDYYGTALVDLDGDGDSEFITAGPNGSQSSPNQVFNWVSSTHQYNRVGTAYTLAGRFFYGTGVLTGDFTGDGKTDVLWLATDNAYLGINNTTNTDQISFASIDNTGLAIDNSSFGNDASAVGDFNNDGDLDFVTTRDTYNDGAYGGKYQIGWGDGAGNFTLETADLVDDIYQPRSLAVNDFNKDGKDDFVLVRNKFNSGYATQVIIYTRNLTNDGFTSFTLADLSNKYYGAITTGDVNGDTYPDIVVLTHASDGIAVYLNSGDGTFSSTPSYTKSIDRADEIFLKDINNDGRLDLLTAYTNSIKYFPQTDGDVISSCSDLANINNNLSSTYLLSQDLDCSGYGNSVMIGTDSNPFIGTFNGQGHTINLSIDSGYYQESGLFRYISGATITNLHLTGSVSGMHQVGALVGYADSSTISLIGNGANVTASGQGGGGIIGYAINTTLNQSFNTGSISTGNNAGGLIGQVTNVTIVDSYNTGYVHTNGASAGGIASDLNSTTIRNCYSTGKVYSYYDNSGGLAGAIEDAGSYVSSSFSAGIVGGGQGYNSRGGLLGFVNTGSPNLINDFWDLSRTGQIYCAPNGETDFAGVGICESENPNWSDADHFKNTSSTAPFATWDFANIWEVMANDYPRLRGISDNSATTSDTAELSEAPTNLSLTDRDSAQISLSWTAPVVNDFSTITGYQINYRTSTNDWQTWPSYPTSANVSITGLAASTSYDFRVYAINVMGTSTDYASSTFSTTPPPASDVYVSTSYSGEGDNDGHVYGYDAFNNITDAVDKVATSGTVHIAPGIYEESNINLTTPGINIVGPGKDASEKATVTSNGNSTFYVNNVPGITISGLVIKQMCEGEGEDYYCQENNIIYAFGGDAVSTTISNNEIAGGWVGLNFGEGISDTKIYNNNFHDNYYGLNLNWAPNFSIHDNVVANNDYTGISLHCSEGGCNAASSTIYNNQISGGQYGIDYEIYDQAAPVIIGPLNEIHGNNVGIYIYGGTGNLFVNNNKIYDNVGEGAVGVNIDAGGSSGAIDASHNYWGSVRGPYVRSSNEYEDSNQELYVYNYGEDGHFYTFYRPYYVDEAMTTLSTVSTSPSSLAQYFNLGSFIVPTGMGIDETTSTLTAEDILISVPDSSGTSSVFIPAEAIISRTDGGFMNPLLLTATSTDTNSLSNLGTGITAKGALKWGLDGIELSFSTPITLHIYVGTDLVGQTLNVVRSEDGSTWTSDGIVNPKTCVVTSEGICAFQATRASIYASTKTTSSSNAPSGGGGGGPIVFVTPKALPQYAKLDFTINGNESTSKSNLLNISMNADPTYVSGYAISLEKSFSGASIIKYTSSTTINLPTKDGISTIYLRYYSPTGNASEIIEHSIEIKTGKTTTTTTSPIITTADSIQYTFKRNLSFGMTGIDVKMLQQYLNNNGFVITKTGAGSPGKETTKFGSATRAALIKFQKANKITPAAGYFGPATRKIVSQ